LSADGRSDFKKLLFRREQPYLYAFDVLMLDGTDLRSLTLMERKRRLLSMMPKVQRRVLYLDHILKRGRDLFQLACERDLEGIVGKFAHGTYQIERQRTSWVKIKNPDYSQMRDRHELFDSRHHRQEVRRSARLELSLVCRLSGVRIVTRPVGQATLQAQNCSKADRPH